MPKVTSKLQLTVPRAIADQYGIRPGDELQWSAAGEAIRVIPAGKNNLNEQERTVKERLELFDQAFVAFKWRLEPGTGLRCGPHQSLAVVAGLLREVRYSPPVWPPVRPKHPRTKTR